MKRGLRLTDATLRHAATRSLALSRRPLTTFLPGAQAQRQDRSEAYFYFDSLFPIRFSWWDPRSGLSSATLQAPRLALRTVQYGLDSIKKLCWLVYAVSCPLKPTLPS